MVKRSPDLLRRYFHDARYGGSAAALAAAIAYRDALLAEIPNWRIHYERSNRNTSGHIGVHLAAQQRGRRIERFWVASWKEGDRYRRRAFSVKRHGGRKARSLAIALRRQKVAAARGVLPELPPREPLSNTGILGVCRRIMRGVPVYVASWRERGKQCMRAFSARRYGEAKARALAIETRRAMHRPPSVGRVSSHRLTRRRTARVGDKKGRRWQKRGKRRRGAEEVAGPRTR